MLSLQPMQALRISRRQLPIRLRRIDEDGVATDIRALEHVQEHEARGLRICRAVGMPGHGGRTGGIAIAQSRVFGAVVRDVDLGAVREVGAEREDGRRAEVRAEVDGGGDGQVFEVLGAESDDLALGYEEGDFVFRLGRQAAELDAGDYGAC